MDLSNTNIDRLVVFSDENNNCIIYGVWGGWMSLTGFMKGTNRPTVKALINKPLKYMLISRMRSVIDDSGECKYSLSASRFDRDQQKMVYACSIIVGKTAEGVHYIHVKDASNGEGMKLDTVLQGEVMEDDKAVSLADKSRVGMVALLDAIENHGTLMQVLTYQKNNGGNGGNGASAMSTGDDVPF